MGARHLAGGDIVSFHQWVEQDGKKIQRFGANPKGLAIYDCNGRFATILLRNDLPKFASVQMACPLSKVLRYPSGSHQHGRIPVGKAAVVHRERACERARLFAKDLFHRLALGEFVDEFVEVVDLAHHGLLNLLHADAAYDAGDQKARRANKGLMHRSRYRSSLCQDRFLTGTSWLERVRGFWNLPRSMRRTHEEESAPTISFVVIIALA